MGWQIVRTPKPSIFHPSLYSAPCNSKYGSNIASTTFLSYLDDGKFKGARPAKLDNGPFLFLLEVSPTTPSVYKNILCLADALGISIVCLFNTLLFLEWWWLVMGEIARKTPQYNCGVSLYLDYKLTVWNSHGLAPS